MNLETYFKKYSTAVDQALDGFLIRKEAYPGDLHEAVRYAVFSGGKRIRPLLAIACAQAVGGRPLHVMPVACALECIHAYSLVHDDLPCMDNDDYRRGRLTVHRKYGEATAILVGDALLTFAFELVSRIKDPEKSVKIARLLSHAAGTLGMVGGQHIDKQYEKREKTLAVMDYINVHKTGKLLAASCVAGARIAGAGRREEGLILRYGEHLGFLFQLVDDIIDGDGYVRFAGREECLRRAENLACKAKQIAAKLPQNSTTLIQIADFVWQRRK